MNPFNLKGILLLIVGWWTIVANHGCQKGVQPVWSQANPSTIVEVSPTERKFSLFNNKDVNLDVAEAEFWVNRTPTTTQPGGSGGKLKGLKIVDNATSVRIANVEQMKEATNMTKVTLDGVTNILGQLNEITKTLAPVLQIMATPAPDGESFLEKAAKAAAALKNTTAPPKPPNQPVSQLPADVQERIDAVNNSNLTPQEKQVAVNDIIKRWQEGKKPDEVQVPNPGESYEYVGAKNKTNT